MGEVLIYLGLLIVAWRIQKLEKAIYLATKGDQTRD